MNLKRTNFLLALITLCLMTNILIQLEIWPTKANANQLGLDPSINYGLVPLNENGSVNVNIASSSEIDVSLVSIGDEPIVYYELDGGAVLAVRER